MTNFLIKLFVGDDCPSELQRQKCGLLAAATGIGVNFFLACIKLLAAVISNSIAVTADAVNNFSDAANSVVTLIGFKISKKPADDEHPFGHGRYEYIAGMIVSLAVVLFGIELFITSVKRAVHPVELSFDILPLIIITVSVLFKLWLFFFYKKISKKINSPALDACAVDSLTDCAATAVSAASLIIFKLFGINLDAYFGMPVAVLIFVSGIQILKSTLDPLIGQPADKKTAEMIYNELTECADIYGVHDLILHSYGAENVFATAHVEMPGDMTLSRAHEIIDSLECAIKEKYSMNMSIHIDPVESDNAFYDQMKDICDRIIKNVDKNISFHDLHIEKSPLETNFIFDVTVSSECKLSEKELKKKIEEDFRRENNSFCAIVTLERKFVE